MSSLRIPAACLALICLFLALILHSAPHPALAQAVCAYSPATADLLSSTTPGLYFDWVRQLSGVAPVHINGTPARIDTRYSYSLFNGASNARAYALLLQQVQEWHYLPAQVEEQVYSTRGWKNLIVTIPGKGSPEQVVVLSAHLDDTSNDPLNFAPGAEDNASGVAALLEAARLFRYYQFEKTIKLIWFSGEEQGLLGSAAFVASHNLSGYQGDVNLDMFGYDSDLDRCIELHVGTLAASDVVGQCFVAGIASYGLNLSYDYITSAAIYSSDHAPFWGEGVGAIEVLENHSRQAAGGCGGRVDANLNYHRTTDTITNSLSTAVGFDIARAGLATVADLAGPLGRCFTASPVLSATLEGDLVKLVWSGLPEAATYSIYRSSRGIDGPWDRVAANSANEWIDPSVLPGRGYTYRIVAVATDGTCQSEASDTAYIALPGFDVFIPLIKE